MKKSKKLISLFLAVLIVLSSLTVGFYAMAADEETTEPERDAAVVAVEEEISNFYSTHRSNLHPRDPEAEGAADAQKAAQEAYDKVSADLKALTDAQKLELNKGNYVYWLYTVGDEVARTLNPDASSVSIANRIDVSVNHLAEIEAVAGDLPAEYQSVYDAVKTATATVAYSVTEGEETTNYYLPDKAKVVYNDNETAQKLVDDFVAALGTFSVDQLNFAGYLHPYSSGGTAGFYFYASSPTTSRSADNIIQAALEYLYYEQQDLLGLSLIHI